MPVNQKYAEAFGSEPPLLADGNRAPDRRDISLRWLIGSALTGLTSSTLMGIALFAALDGQEQLAIPAEAMTSGFIGDNGAFYDGRKSSRVIQATVPAKLKDRVVMEIPTMIQDGSVQVVRREPFARIRMALAANHTSEKTYPRFDPLKMFSAEQSDAPATQARIGTLYGAQVESEVNLKVTDFPVDRLPAPLAEILPASDIEEMVRQSGSALAANEVKVASLYYIDPRRFGGGDFGLNIPVNLNARVVEENVSIAAWQRVRKTDIEFVDDIITISEDVTIETALRKSGYSAAQAATISRILVKYTETETLSPGSVLRVGVQQTDDYTRIVRASVYDQEGRHRSTAALNDRGLYVQGTQPPVSIALAAALEQDYVPAKARRDLPRIYDGVNRAALSYGLSDEMVARVVRLLASNVDLQGKLRPSDTLEVFFSAPDADGNASEDSELLFVRARIGGNEMRYYHFRDPQTGAVDYFDEEGKSIRQFLLRNPVPNGVFRSAFGMRRHPILGYRRMHTGVDWAAPRGTPIIAAGNGIVEKAGWDSSGYGRQTIIRHANGYQSSYSHKNRIAEGIVPGARVRQGQVIGYVGSTGLSTGPHLHYELLVNGTKVDPMRVRLPDNKVLEGDTLTAFLEERERIDSLLGFATDTTQVASR